MSSPSNYATAQCGASLVEVSAEGSKVASNAMNLLYGRDDLMWLAGEAPQFVTLRLGEHPPLRYVGWHVWHDYLTNPKTVVVHSGRTRDDLALVVECSALPGAGTQLWELSTAIPESHNFVRFTVAATFGPGPTYANYFCLHAEHPGAAFRDRPVETAAATRPTTAAADVSFGSPNPVSSLLRELDEDIRMLHPIKAVSPTKTKLLTYPHQPLPLPPLPAESARVAESIQLSSRDASPAMRRHGTDAATAEGAGGGLIAAARIDALERSMMALQAAVELQARELSKLRQELASSRAAGSSPISEAMLRNFAEEVIAPKLQKHAKRTEAKVLQRVDQYLHDLMRNVSDVAEEQVAQRLHEIALDDRTRSVDTSRSKQQHAPMSDTLLSHAMSSSHHRRLPGSTHFGK